MNQDKFLIVIGRQYGCGGRELAEHLARRLGVAFYDKKLLDSAAERYGFSPGIFAQADEKKPSLMRSLLSHSYGVAESFGLDTLSAEKLYEAQSNVIRSICDSESCIMIGRTADYVMRHHPNMVSVFLHAPIDDRSIRIMQRQETLSKRQAQDKARENDRQRKKYYDYFTDGEWGRADNYHLCLDTSRISLDQASDLIISYCRQRGLNLQVPK